MKSSASCWRVASRRSKWCPARAKAAQASSSIGSSSRCTVLWVWGRAGDTASLVGPVCCPPLPPPTLPVPHVDIAEEAVLGGLGAAERGPVKLLCHRPQDTGAGLPESLGGTMAHGGGDMAGGSWGGHSVRGVGCGSGPCRTHHPSLRRGEVEELQVGITLQGPVQVLEGPVHPGHQRRLCQTPPVGTPGGHRGDLVATIGKVWGPREDTGDTAGTRGPRGGPQGPHKDPMDTLRTSWGHCGDPMRTTGTE